jgi:phage terminase large subunit
MWRRILLLLVLVLTVTDAEARAVQSILRWRERPEAFVYEQFGVTPDAWQLDVLKAWADPAQQHIAMQACAGPGKTAVLAWCGWNFLSCYGDRVEHPKGFAFSVTDDNLHDNLWAEMAKWQGCSEYLSTAFTWRHERIYANDHPQTWFLAPRSWPKTANPDEQGKTLSGLHSKYILVLGDEVGAIPATVLRAGEQALSTKPTFGKMLVAGNPISLEGMLYVIATQLRHQWTIVRITGDPDDPKRSPRIDLDWAREQIHTYGRENPWVMSYLLGMFPPASINALLGIEEVQAAMQRHLRRDEYDYAQKRIGVDVARFGDDRTVIFPRQGLASFRPVVMRNARTTDIAARVALAHSGWGAEQIFVDDTGHWGHGVIDNLLAANIPAIPLVYHAPALDKRYKNRRAEFWLEGAKWVKRGGALPNLPEFVAELTTPTYTFMNGVFVLEPKELVKKRLGRSPDLADALFQTFAIPDMPAAQLAGVRRAQTVAHDADPYAERRDDYGIGNATRDFDPFIDVRNS